MPSYPRVEVVGVELEARADGKHHGRGGVGLGEGLATVASGVDDHVEVVVDGGFVEGQLGLGGVDWFGVAPK
jgi:hypothetical protein